MQFIFIVAYWFLALLCVCVCVVSATGGAFLFFFTKNSENQSQNIFSRLLERTSHPKVWLAFAKFEQNQGKWFDLITFSHTENFTIFNPKTVEDEEYYQARDVYREATGNELKMTFFKEKEKDSVDFFHLLAEFKAQMNTERER